MPLIRIAIDTDTDRLTASQARALAPFVVAMAAEARQQQDAQRFMTLSNIVDLLKARGKKTRRARRKAPPHGTTTSPAAAFQRP